MIIANLLGSLVGGALGVRRKSHFGAGRFLRHGSGSFLNGSTILTAAALGWAGYEIWRNHAGPGGVAQNPTFNALGSAPRIPGSAPAAPSGGLFSSPARSTVEVVPDPIDGVSRIAGLLVAAARADGELGEEEYGAIVREARNAGADQRITAEIQSPRPIEVLVAGVRDPKLASDLYVLAFTIVRADEDVNPRERAFLDKLGGLLGLDKGSMTRLESDAVRRISSAS